MTSFYYTTDGKKFSSKILGSLHAKNINSSLHWYYNDKEFLNADWKTEPKETLDELYFRRAQQLRDQYKKIAICYSGGYDSTNIINTFIKNNLFIDEVIVVGALSKDSYSGSDENHNGEIYHNVFPKLKELDSRTKVTLIDYTTLWDKLELVKQNDAEALNDLNTHYSPHHWFWYQLNDFIIHKENTAIIWGCDKPILIKEGKKYYNYFSDATATSYGMQGRLFRDRELGTVNVNFYWSIDTISLMVKQCHTLKYFYDRYHTEYGEQQTKLLINAPSTEREQYIAKIIYPDIQLKFKSPKSKTLYFSLRDSFLAKEQDSSIFKLYKAWIHSAKNYNFSLILSRGYEIC